MEGRWAQRAWEGGEAKSNSGLYEIPRVRDVAEPIDQKLAAKSSTSSSLKGKHPETQSPHPLAYLSKVSAFAAYIDCILQ